jgi:hypothetical protein
VDKCKPAGNGNCPECYAASDCSTGEPLVGDLAGHLDLIARVIYCREALSAATPTQAEATCEDGVAKAFAKLWGAKTKCYAKCIHNMDTGKIALGSCTPGAVTDAATQACLFDPLKGAEAKAAAAIDQVCASVSANPVCYVNVDTGAKWVQTYLESTVDEITQAVQCGSPSGAFLY